MVVSSDRCFGPFRLDPATGELWKSGIRIKLQDQPALILTALTERPGELVTREELRQRLWPDGTHVDFDHALTTAVKKLRRALNDSPQNPRYVETLPRRGYRFVADIEAGKEAAEPAPAVSEHSAGLGRNRRAVLASLALVALCGVFWVAARGPEPTPAPTRRFAFSADVAVEPYLRQVTISPDGHAIAFVSTGSEGSSIWVRELDDEVPRRIDGTDGAVGLFWAPGSRRIGFATGAELKRVSVQGGGAFTICPLPGLRFAGGAWSPDGNTIVFAADVPATLFEVDVSGGAPEVALEPVVIGSGGGNRDPWFLSNAGESRVLAFAAGGPADFRLIVRRLETGEQVELGPGRLPASSPSGHLLFQLPGPEAGVWAIPFSTAKMAALGPAFLVAAHGRSPSVAADGTLVLGDPPSGGGLSRLVMLDRRGASLGVVLEGSELGTPAISPDGNRIAFRMAQGRNNDIWVQSLEDERRMRLSFDPTVDGEPVWSPGGEAVGWRSDARGNADILWSSVDRDGEPDPLVSTPSTDRPGGWTPDGRGFLFTTTSVQTGSDVWLADTSGPEGRVELRPLLDSAFQEISPAVSPRGRLFAYCSNESGQYEVYVRSLDGDFTLQASAAGGCQPRWTQDGRELLYVEDETLMAVPVSATPELALGRPQPLFRNPNLATPLPFLSRFDAWPDGQRFVLVERPQDAAAESSQIHIVENWLSEHLP